MKTLVTGASGFVGTTLLSHLHRDDRFIPVAASRRPPAQRMAGVQWVASSDLTEQGSWARALDGIDAVVHLAARVHIMGDTAGDPLVEFRKANVEGTIRLARQAAAAGVRRFVFVSSVKVNGESGSFVEADPPHPSDAYGISKHEAELGLRLIAEETGMEVVTIRPPLVYGLGVRANFGALIRAVRRGVPLPLGAIHNRRSLVAVDNFADLIMCCLDHPAAAGETFFASDGEDLSTTDLVRRLARAMNRPARLVPVPPRVLLAIGALLGKGDVVHRLVDSLYVDISKARRTLGWNPPVSVGEGLRRTVAALP